MTQLQEIEKIALTLPEADRAKLAAHLLETLPPCLMDEDDGVAEALRRESELEANPETRRTWTEIKRELGRE